MRSPQQEGEEIEITGNGGLDDWKKKVDYSLETKEIHIIVEESA